MGSTISYNGESIGKNTPNKSYRNSRKRNQRRDSLNRPVLKLQIRSESMETHHKVNGETSLDHPFLRRLSSKKFGVIESLERNTMPRYTTITSSQSNNKVTLSERLTQSQELPSASSNSAIMLQFIENEEPLPANPVPVPEYFGEPKPKTEYDHFCVVKYGREEKAETDTMNRAREQHLMYYDDMEPICCRSCPYSVISLNKSSKAEVNSNRRPSVTITRKLTRTTSLQEELKHYSNNLDVHVDINDHELSFGEDILQHLEKEGIILFDFENPQTSVDKEIDQMWPELKHKMKRWKSQESLLDT